MPPAAVKPEKRPPIDVMISSTSLDLPLHRLQATDAVLRCRFYPWVMETLGATPGDAIDESLKMVDKAEIYVGIFGMRYGYIPDDPARNPERVSITEMEYRRAVERDIPVLIFIMDKKHAAPTTVEELDTFTEKSAKGKAKLKALKAELEKKHVVGYFKSPEELRTLLIQALNNPDVIEKARAKAGELDPLPEPDAADTGIPQPPDVYSVPPYILTNTFIGRKMELRELDEWAESDDAVLVIDAIGGMGKSALAWEWIHERAAGFDGIFWYSFYEGGATMTSFIRHALAYVTRQKPDDLKNMPYEERVNKLLAALQGGRWLLVLDGFERALVAYHRWNAAQMRDDEVDSAGGERARRAAPLQDDSHDDVRACTDPRDDEFLLKLAGCQPSKALVSSRLMPRRLEDLGDPIPGVRHKHLNGMHPEDAYQLMRDRGVKTADRHALDRFMKQFGYHSLLLKMIAGRVKNFRRAPGDFDQWCAAEGQNLHLSKLDIKQNRTHILQYAFEGLDNTKRKLLSQVAAFSDAVAYDTLAVFNPYLPPKPEEVEEPAHGRLEMYREWLEDHQESEESDEGLKEYVQREIADLEARLPEQEAAYEAYQKALDGYYKSDAYRAAVATFDAALTELEERGLLQWNREKDRYDLHPVVRGYSFDQLEGDEKTRTFDRIRDHFESQPPEDEETAVEISDLHNTIEIYRALLGAGRLDDAAAFYDSRLGDVLFYNVAAYHTVVELLSPLFPDGVDRLPALSDPAQQSNIMNILANMFSYVGRNDEALALEGLKLRLNLDMKDADRLGVGLRNYASSLRDGNQPAAAQRACELARELAEAAGDKDGLAMAHFYLLGIYKDTGRWSEAEAAYAVFSAKPPSYQTSYWQSFGEQWCAETLIYRGLETAEALDKAEALAQQSRNALGLWGIQRLRGEVALHNGQPEAAAGHFQETVRLARKTGGADTATYLGCLARARAAQGRHDAARELIEEALAQTYKGEIHNLYNSAAEVYLALGERDQAEEYAIKAYQSAWADGPPHVFWWELERAKKVLDDLGVAYPEMPPFDPATVKPLPYEDDIRAFIEELKAKKDESTP